MKVAQLIDILKTFPDELEVHTSYDYYGTILCNELDNIDTAYIKRNSRFYANEIVEDSEKMVVVLGEL
jgi:hypothetical protein